MAKNDKNSATAPVSESAETPRTRRWMRPSKRAGGYAKERKENRHTRGEKKGEELDDYNKGLRSGYLLCQSDHAGAFKYGEAIKAGKSKEEAAIISRTIGKPKNNGGNAA